MPLNDAHDEAIRTMEFGSPAAATRVVIIPGLGLPSYVIPTATALAVRGMACSVLDLPGFGSTSSLSCAPDVTAMGRAAAAWIARLPVATRVVVMGHSTGSQAALTAALDVQHSRPDAALVMAGPTFHPAHRGPVGLALATLTAYRDETLSETVTVVPDLVRGHLRVVRIIASGMRDRPERRLAALRLPLVLTAGEHDTYAPRSWLETLARAASRSPAVTSAVLAGSHNNLYTHPGALARLIDTALRA
ncbi:alpha/beta hydrolase [Lapillicoccus sp.]|uniref:alpha/beta fold hydrolase n=1 Tax=Lapillicoccus sp. TaxID=1909287 RepID=UPI0025FBE2B4|nr:alpha/beta hydrolase [Lapillicoccus sp.]